MRPFLVALTVGFAFGAYAVLRYLGLWMENDTTEFVRHTNHVLAFGPSSDGGYPHGYAYTTWAALLSSVSGVDVMTLFQRYTPLLGHLLLATFGFATFRAWLRSDRLGLAAALTLFLVPELVFTVSRGNHEKFTTALTLLAALAALHTFRLAAGAAPARLLAPWVVTFYLAAFTTVTMNVFFGSAFIAASTLALAGVWLLRSLSPHGVGPRLRSMTRELPTMVTTAWVWVLFVMFYAYPTASQNLGLLGNTVEGIGAMAQSGTAASDPYAQIASAWASPEIYTLVSSFRWVLFAASFAAAVVLASRLLRKPAALGLDAIVLLAYYGAFGFLLALAIPVDFVGLSAGSNLQVRLYTYFALFAAPMAVAGVASVRPLRGRIPRAVWALPAALLVAAFAVISALKATVDPAVSNHWVFYRPAEMAAVTFWDERQSFDAMWLGPRPRILYAYRAFRGEDSINGNRFNRAPFSSLARDGHALVSEVVVAEATALSAPLSPVLADDRVYDNGEVQIHHRLPRTPHQR